MSDAPARGRLPLRLVSRISRLEWVCGAAAIVVLAGLVVAEPDIVTTPFASARAIVAVIGGTVLAAVAMVVMLRLGVPPIVRVLVLGVPLVVTSWWLIAPFFDDTVVDDDFATSIAAERNPGTTLPPATAAEEPAPDVVTPPTPPTPPPTTGPQLVGSGSFVGLAGHDGTGDGGIFRLADGSHVLRLENFDIDNGPDLQLYLVPGADSRSPDDDAHHFGALRGNIGDQTYEIPTGFPVAPGPWTVLVWCEAFTVEFVAATLTVV